MSKFMEIVSMSGQAVLERRAEQLTKATKEYFEDAKRQIERAIRERQNAVFNMEDLSVKSTDSLIVGEKLDSSKWVLERIQLEYEIRDLKQDLMTIESLIEKYFDE